MNYRSSYGYSDSSGMWVFVVALVLAIVGTVLAYIFIMPKEKVKGLNKFWYFVHNVFSFKTLLVEKIFKALYVFVTIYLLLAGFLSLFNNFLAGLLMMTLGPIGARISFEMIMMFILLVQNVSAIRSKLCDDEDEGPAHTEKQPPKEYVFCAACGTRYNKLDAVCPGCGLKNPAAAPAQQPAPVQQPAPAQQPIPTPVQKAAPVQQFAPAEQAQHYAPRPTSSYGFQNPSEGYTRDHRRFQPPQDPQA